MKKASSLDIPGPEVIKVGLIHDLPFMIMNKVEGTNGSKCSQDDQLTIWNRLGEYANKIHGVKQIDELKITTYEFHPIGTEENKDLDLMMTLYFYAGLYISKNKVY